MQPANVMNGQWGGEENSASASNRHVPFHHATVSTLRTGSCCNVQVQREVPQSIAIHLRFG